MITSSSNSASSLPVPEITIPDSFRRRSFSDVVKRINDKNIGDDIQSFSYDPESKKTVHELGRELFAADSAKSSGGSQSKKTEAFLEQFTPIFREKYSELQSRVMQWKAIRIPLIGMLEKYIEKLDKNFKICSAVRFFASTADVSGSIGGILLEPESDWKSFAFNAASVCGFCGLISTVLEVASSKKILDEVTDVREEDYKLFELVVKWFQENLELDFAVQNLFPHGIDKDVALQIQAASTELEEYLKVFESALISNVRKDSRLLGNKDFLYSLQLFSRSDIASLWWNRIIFRKHPIQLDINRMTLQLEFSQMQSLVFQSIPALPLEQQRLNSLPVAGRIMLNFLTMYDAYTDIRSGAKSMHSDKLRKLLRVMEKELEIINDAVEKMQPFDLRVLT